MISWSQIQGYPGGFDARRWNAVEAGYEADGAKLYVGRGNLQGGVHCGKIHQAQNACYIPLFGDEHRLDNFEVLTVPPGVSVQWVPGSNGQVPPNAVPGGTQDGSPTYIGRIPFNGTVTPGEIVPKENCCYISFMGKEESSQNYEVLCSVGGGQPMPYMQPHAAATSAPVMGGMPPVGGMPPGGVPSVTWVTQSGSFNAPAMNAFEAGYDRLGAKLYVGRSLLAGGCHVGKVRCDIGTCYVPYEGGEETFNQFQVLTAPYGVTLQWVPASNGNVPANAVEGGYNEDRSKTYVGRAQHDGAFSPGEVVPKDGLLYIAHEGREVEFERYDVLVLGPPGQGGYAGNPSAPPF